MECVLKFYAKGGDGGLGVEAKAMKVRERYANSLQKVKR